MAEQQDLMFTIGFDTKDAEKQAEALAQEVDKILEGDKGTQDTKIAQLDAQMIKAMDTSKALREQLQAIREDTSMPTEDYAKLTSSLQTSKEEMEGLVELYKENEYTIKSLSSDLEVLGAQGKVQTEEYKKVVEQIARVNSELSHEEEQLELLKASDISKNDEYYIEKENRVKELTAEYEKLIAQQERLKASGKDMIDSKETEEYKNTLSSLNEYTKAQEEIKEKQREITSEIQETVKAMREMQGEGTAFGIDEEAEQRTLQNLRDANNQLIVARLKHREITGEAKKTNEQLKSTAEHIKKASLASVNLKSSFQGINNVSKKIVRSILRWGFGISTIFVLINKLRNILQQGMSQLYETGEYKKYNDQIDNLKSSLATLKNAFIGAFAPIATSIIPYLTRLADWLTKVMDLLAQFMAALSGQKTYLRAIKQTTKASEEAAKATDEQSKSLSKLDKLNVISSNKQKEEEKEEKPGPMFEEVPIDNKILDWINKIKEALKAMMEYLAKLKDKFLQGFFDALGNWRKKLESIISDLRTIWDLLKEIFTDPKVTKAMDEWAQSFAYMLGSLTGLIANIGLTMAQMLVGGFKKFLESKKEDIKQWLVDIFGVGTEINTIWADTFQSLSRIVDVFGGENGQRLVAGAMSIAYEIYSNISLLVGKLFRDLSNIATLWIRDNEEKLAQMIDDILGWGADILDSVQQLLDEVFDYAQQVYDEHFKPLFDTIAKDVSELVGSFLEIWESDIKPWLDTIKADIDQVLNNDIKPALMSFLDSLGAFADFVKELWTKVIKPCIAEAQKYIPAVLNLIKGKLDFLKGIIRIFANTFKTHFEALKHIFKAFTLLLKGDVQGALSETGKAFTAFKDGILKNFKIIWETLKEIIGDLGGWLKGLGEGIGDILDKLDRKMHGTGSAMAGDSRYKVRGAATGAVIPPQMSERLVRVGDNNRETEIISPLSTMKQALAEALQQTQANNTGGGDIIIQIDGREVFRAVRTQANQYSNQHGGRSAFA